MAPSARQQDRHAFYGGKVQSSAVSAGTFQSIDPSTAQPVATIHTSAPATVEAAIASAASAFPSWSSTPPLERSRILHRAVALLRARNDELARIETLDTGKPYSETSTVDIVTGADVLEYYASFVASGGLNGEAFHLRAATAASPDSGASVFTTKEPLGVCAAIGAWNYPIQIALWKASPCLAAGNTLVYKPSEFTPLHAQYLAEIFHEAGVPDGVFNVVYGAGDVGAKLSTHPAIAKVSFTGQVSTGKKVAAAAAGGMKYVTMELGGKSPLVVLPECDVESAVDGAMMANFYSSGQVCTNGTRVFVPRAMKAEFERVLVHKMAYVRAGDLFDMNTNFGPLSSSMHRDKVVSYIRHGIETDKARLLYGGDTRTTAENAVAAQVPEALIKGFLVQPNVLNVCVDSMKIVTEEIFGPVMCILPYDSVEEAVKRANTTELGLAAGVFGKNITQCHRVVSQLQAGITWINTWGESPAEMAVGGWKSSGLGVENGRKGIEAWVKNKSTLVELGGVVPTVFAKL